MKSRWLNFPPYQPNAIHFPSGRRRDAIRRPVPVAFTAGAGTAPYRGAVNVQAPARFMRRPSYAHPLVAPQFTHL